MAIIQRVTQLLQRNFVRNVLLVAGGTAGAQAITMAFAPFITRLYGPEAFGQQGTFVAILAVLLPISALTYPIAMVLPKTDQQAIGLGKLSLLLASVLTLVLALVVWGFGAQLAELLNLQSIQAYLWLLPLALWLAAVQQIIGQWVIRKQEFKVSAMASVVQALSLNVAKLGVGFWHPVGAVLIALSSVSAGINALLLWLGLARKKRSNPVENKALDSEQAPTNLLQLAKQHRDFPCFRAPQVLLSALSQSLPVLILASFFGPAAAGFYALGKTILALPATLIGKSVGDVFYPRITAAAQQQQPLRPLLLKATAAMAGVGVAPFAVVIAFGPWLFAWVFGSEWWQAGEYARWMSVWMFFAFLNRPSVAAIATLGLQAQFLVYEVISVVLRLAALYVGFVLFASDLMAVALFSLVGAVLNLALVGYTLAKT